MNNLDIYEQYGFKFFTCHADKSPNTAGFYIDGDPRCWDEKENKYKNNYDWKQPENHITKEQAEVYQSTGRMIGAWIPENIIVVDLDKHEGKPNGVKTMNEIKKKYNINYSINDNTFFVQTSGNGFHIFYTTDKTWRQNSKAPGVDLKTNKGYVIAAGSPGYNIQFDNEPMELPFELEQWLFDCEKENKKEAPEKNENKDKTAPKKLPVKSLKRILKKINPENFNNNDRWLEFIMSCIAVSGNTPDVHVLLDEWSKTDSRYSEERNVVKRIQSFDEIRDITAGTFIHILREENISQHIISQVTRLESISATLINAENNEISLPFPDPDYMELARKTAAREYFEMRGNTAAASILESAMSGVVIWDDSNKEPYYFDGNKWIVFQDFYAIIYTIIYRAIKILYENTEGDREDNENMYKCVSTINQTHWKSQTWKEFCSKPSIYRKSVQWDSPEIKETITTIDGVIDFKNNKIESRKGTKEEYRRSHFDYYSEEILQSGKPEIFHKFFKALFQDERTLETATFCVSMAISGNSGKRLFQLWKGIGSNGKSTLVETIKHVLGDKSYKYPNQLLLADQKNDNYKTELAKFQGKYFCYATEADKGSRLSQNTIKDMTGDEAIGGKELYKSPVEFEATWQMIYSVNDLPSFHGDDFAFNDRLLVIPFNTVFFKDNNKKQEAKKRGINDKYLVKANSDPSYKKSLYKEKAGIIMWMIRKYIELNTEHGGVIPESPECILHKTKYIKDNDETGVFIKELCEIDETGEKGWYSIPADLVESYRDFTGMKKKGERTITREIRDSHQRIGDTVKRLMVKNEYGHMAKRQVRVLTNIILKDLIIESETETIQSVNHKTKKLTNEELAAGLDNIF